jgi:hypothetical protein
MSARRARTTAVVLAFCSIAGAAPAAAQKASVAESWLSSLYDDMAPELAAGRPLVVQVHVPLCDNDVLRCGRGRLGDGEDADGNLYWATSGGFRGWFGRKGSGWRLVHTARAPEEDVIEVRVWRRKVSPGAGLRARGVRKAVPVYVVAYAWRGESIARAMSAYAADLFGGKARRIALPDGEVLAAGGAARLVAFVGHNGWMDVADFAWPRTSRKAARKATIAVACITEDYLVPAVPDERRVPLLFTRSLLFAGAHAFEGAVSSFAAGDTLAGIRESAVRAYAAGQGKPLPRVRAAFTNPADRKWKHRSP